MSDELFPRPVRGADEIIDTAAETIRAAQAEHQPSRTLLLISGGNDSNVLLDACAHLADEIVHINTGIGIEETNEFARRVGTSYDRPFVELAPPVSYDELVLGRWEGFPGPGAHRFTYQRLKERAIEARLRQLRSFRGERFMLLTGVRRAESRRRMGYSDPVDRRGGQVWVNPLLDVSNPEMGAYRVERELPVNEVSEHLHMSGECLCGAMADQDQNRQERAAIRFFYPAMDRRISDLEASCRAAGKRYCEWGVKRPDDSTPVEMPGQTSLDLDDFMPLCEGCEGRRERSEDGAA